MGVARPRRSAPGERRPATAGRRRHLPGTGLLTRRTAGSSRPAAPAALPNRFHPVFLHGDQIPGPAAAVPRRSERRTDRDKRNAHRDKCNARRPQPHAGGCDRNAHGTFRHASPANVQRRSTKRNASSHKRHASPSHRPAFLLSPTLRFPLSRGRNGGIPHGLDRQEPGGVRGRPSGARVAVRPPLTRCAMKAVVTGSPFVFASSSRRLRVVIAGRTGRRGSGAVRRRCRGLFAPARGRRGEPEQRARSPPGSPRCARRTPRRRR